MKNRVFKQHLFDNKSAWVKIVVSYFIIMMFSLLVISAVSAYSYHQIKTEIIYSNTMKLEMVKDNFDKVFSEMERMWQRMLNNKCLRELRSLKPRSSDYYLKINEFLSEPTINEGLYTHKFDYYFYLSNGDMIVTENSAIDRLSYYETAIAGKGIGFDEWSGKFFEGRGKRVEIIPDGETGKDIICFIYPIPFSRVNKAEIVLIIYLHEDELFEAHKPIFSEDKEAMSIVSKDGVIMFKGDIKAGDPPADLKADEMRIVSANRRTSFFARSSIGGYTYIIEVSNGEFMAKLKPVLSFIFILTFIYLLVGGILIVFAAKRNYMPIKELFGLVTQNGKARAGNNEFDIIKSEIMRNVEEYNRVKNEFQSHKQTSQAIGFAEMIIGRIHDDKLSQMYPDLYNELEHGVFTILAVTGEVYKNNEYRPAERVEKNLITDMLQQRLAERYIAFTSDIDDNMIFAVKAYGDYKSEINSAVFSAQQYLSKTFDIDIKAAAGAARAASANKLREIYLEAVFALGTAQGAECVCYYDELDAVKLNITYQFSGEYEEAISRCIRSGNLEKAQMCIKQLFEMNTLGGEANIKIIQILAYDLLAMILKMLHSMANVTPDISEDIYKTCMLINEYNIDAIKEAIFEIVSKVCRISDSEPEGKTVEKIMHIIEKEYNNPDLSNATIAEQLSINPQYLSRLVKNNTGRGLPELISERRVAEAKKMLKFGMKVENVSQSTGFSNIRNFRRVFVKYTGITPQEYKQGVAENSEEEPYGLK